MRGGLRAELLFLLVAGNAFEPLTAITVAMKNKMTLHWVQRPALTPHLPPAHLPPLLSSHPLHHTHRHDCAAHFWHCHHLTDSPLVLKVHRPLTHTGMIVLPTSDTATSYMYASTYSLGSFCNLLA